MQVVLCQYFPFVVATKKSLPFPFSAFSSQKMFSITGTFGSGPTCDVMNDTDIPPS